MTKEGWLYLMASKPQGTLYLGCTSHPAKRIWQHRNGLIDDFSKKYRCTQLVWIAKFGNLHDARQRERQMKGWKRAWKIELIERENSEWRDLYPLLNA